MSVDYRSMGLTDGEWKKIVNELGREPNLTETGIISVMWSEHCSYKNSRKHLKRFPTKGSAILQGPGENAGVVDIGDDMAATFKVESHNHPSAVEPYEGAATGVGGILRDIFTMGARPIASFDSLRFGDLSKPENRHIAQGVVSGIAGYGNCIGVPTVGGEFFSDSAFDENPLVNVCALGIMKKDALRKAIAGGPGNHVYIVGSSTGRDGIHGATFASDELSDERVEDRASVQAGDPFAEKMLLEACLELYQHDYIVGIQDMGAAGITCSTFEMSEKGQCGMDVELDRIPQREPDMSPYEIMLSESQERMLMVVKQGFEDEVEAIFNKWDVHVERVGEVIPEKEVIIRKSEKIVARLPVDFVVNGFPVYDREYVRPKYLDNIDLDINNIPEKNIEDSFKTLLASPNICSKKSVFRQYDHQVQLNTLVKPGEGDAAVLRLKDSKKALSFSIDCNSRHCFIDPYLGAKEAVFEAARNLVMTGAKPIAATDGLNFGNPMDKEVYWQFVKCVDGIIDACNSLETPITGGNVSFYNQSGDKAVYPTPVIGMLGLIEDRENTRKMAFKKGNLIGMLGKPVENLGGSEFLKAIHNKVNGPIYDFDSESELLLNSFILQNIEHIDSLHDVADGGLVSAIYECAYHGNTGVDIDIEYPFRKDAYLFSEAFGRVIFSADKDGFEKIREKAKDSGIFFTKLGKCEGERFKINDDIDLDMKELNDIYIRSL